MPPLSALFSPPNARAGCLMTRSENRFDAACSAVVGYGILQTQSIGEKGKEERTMFRDKAGNFSVGKSQSARPSCLYWFSSCSAAASSSCRRANPAWCSRSAGQARSSWIRASTSKIPFVQKIVMISNRIVKTEVTTEAFSKDLQTVSSVIAVNYHINKASSSTIYTEVGMSFEDVLITPAINEVLKAVTAQVHRAGARRQPRGRERPARRKPERQAQRVRHLH